MDNALIKSKHLITNPSVDLIGGKAARLAQLSEYKCQVPSWFCLSTKVFQSFLKHNHLPAPHLVQSTEERKAMQQRIIEDSKFPLALLSGVRNEINQILQQADSGAVSVRSSATAEDSLSASYAGLFDTFLGVTETEKVLKKIKNCWASLWSERAIEYRNKQNDPAKMAMAVIVQTFIPADISGIIFTTNPLTKNPQECVIEASWGLGELIVSGQITPDHFVIEKMNRNISTELGNKHSALFWNTKANELQHKPVFPFWQKKTTLSNDQIIRLTEMGQELEKGFGYPLDIEWAIYQGNIYLLQSRPVVYK